MTDETISLNAALPNLRADTEALDTLEERLYALKYAVGEISTLAEIIDPAKATADRGIALGRLQQEIQELMVSPETGALLDRLDKHAETLGGMRAAQVRIMRRDRAAIVDVPVEMQRAFVELTNEATDVWVKAKQADDWASFEPYLQKVVDSMIEIAHARKPEADPYDVWLSDFEYGADRAFYDAFFDQVREGIVPLLAATQTSRHKPSAACMKGTFDESRQWALAHDLVKLEGVDEGALWLGATEHPFMGGPSSTFVVIAGHVYPDDILSNVFSILHEGGHALYEQNVNPSIARTSLGGGTSMGMHEAQSRFFENIIGRSRAFARPLLETMQKHFKGQLSRVTPNQLYMAENVVCPSLVRTEADELTYPLHILVRYEIEQKLFSGEAKASDVPRLWKELYKGYLGVDVPSDKLGALQDTHWAFGGLGYFPTYALGNAYGAQLRHQMIEEGIDLDGACAAGNLAPIREWLRSRIWVHGRSKDAGELIEGACGEPFSATYYIDYLTEKFSGIYQL